MKAARLRDLKLAELRRMVRSPMSAFETQDLRERTDLPPRVELASNEQWSCFVYVNSRYGVQVSHVDTPIGLVTHLWIRQHAGEMPPWRDKRSQRLADRDQAVQGRPLRDDGARGRAAVHPRRLAAR